MIFFSGWQESLKKVRLFKWRADRSWDRACVRYKTFLLKRFWSMHTPEESSLAYLFHKSTEIMTGRLNGSHGKAIVYALGEKKISIFYYFIFYRNHTSNYRSDTIWQVNAIWCVRFDIFLNFITSHYKCKSMKLENRTIVPGMWHAQKILFQA